MKSMVYLVAGLAALGIAVVVISSPSADTQEAPPAAQNASAVTADLITTPVTFEEPGSLTLDVPGMHCQFACFPRVKETLEGEGTVSEVVLAEQPNPNSLTVKKVIVKYDAGFDVSAALKRLHSEGFTSAAAVQ